MVKSLWHEKLIWLYFRLKGIKTENKLFKTKFQCRKYVDKWIFCLFCKYNNNNINQETMEYESDVETISNCSRAISRFYSILANFFPVAKYVCKYWLDCPMSQHMSQHWNTTKNIQQTTQQKTLNATYNIGQFDIKELNVICQLT